MFIAKDYIEKNKLKEVQSHIQKIHANEIFMPINDERFEDYFVSQFGRVLSTKRKTQRVLKEHITPKTGYSNVCLMNTYTGKSMQVKLHQIVGRTWLIKDFDFDKMPKGLPEHQYRLHLHHKLKQKSMHIEEEYWNSASSLMYIPQRYHSALDWTMSVAYRISSDGVFCTIDIEKVPYKLNIEPVDYYELLISDDYTTTADRKKIFKHTFTDKDGNEKYVELECTPWVRELGNYQTREWLKQNYRKDKRTA